MMKKTVFVFAGILFAVLFSSCASFQAFSKTEKKADAKTVKPVDRYPGAIMLRALVKDDAESFLKFLPREVREEFGINGFKNTRDSMMKEYGKIVSYTYIADLQHPKYRICVWKVHFQRKSSDKTRTIDQETMFRTITVTLDEKETLIDWRFL